ncbi:CHAP domain-containing protein [Ancylobacter terrae]|uniref:CHAP domain-containing protein n=1 Tax=Ancylobacter sp. sgz301288 TaxID=3342077 RepID=UPI00385F7C35
MPDPVETAPLYPGHLLKPGTFDSLDVQRVQARLNQLLGSGLLEDGDFGEATENAVRLFQARYTDPNGGEIDVDGRVGPETWAALFGAEALAPPSAPAAGSGPREAVLTIARGQIGVREEPVGSNRGPQVDLYHRAAGINPAAGNFPWCVSFVQWVFAQAFAGASPLFRTAGVHALWSKRQTGSITVVPANKASAQTVKPGMVFLLDTGGGKGHAGIVEAVNRSKGTLTTIEGNTNNGGSREGYGVFRRTTRKIRMPGLLGYIDYCP